MPSVYDVDCQRCGMPLGSYSSKSQALAAMREHERMFHGATGNISFRSKADPTFEQGKKSGFSFW